jgi:histidinol-phosphate aminotransferase
VKWLDHRPDVCPAVHGGLDLQELRGLGVAPETVLDFSVCINPYGPSPRVRAALANVCLDRYPDRGAVELRAALAQTLDIAAASILPGNGVSELIGLVAISLLRPGERVLIVGPTYAEYARATTLARAVPLFCQARAQDDFAVPVAAIAPLLMSAKPRLVFLCNPNNPTGACLPPETIASWARQHEDMLFVIDEAYQPFAPALGSMVRRAGRNVLVLRSMTKDYALAALRLGYAVGTPALIALLARAQPPWSVNALAQTAGVAALGDPPHLAWGLAELARATESLRSALFERGPLSSAANFFLLRVGDAAAVRLALLHRSILVRDCASFGLPDYIRIAPRKPQDNTLLVAALSEVLR